MKELLFNLPTSERKVFAKHFLSGVNVDVRRQLLCPVGDN